VTGHVLPAAIGCIHFFEAILTFPGAGDVHLFLGRLSYRGESIQQSGLRIILRPSGMERV
jgi:hypothetical protein